MNTFPVRIGVDDIATETQKLDGWTYFCLPEVYVAEFATAARGILSKTILPAFHGKEYVRRFRSEYRDFLTLIRQYIMVTLQGLSVCALSSEKRKSEISALGSELLCGSMKRGEVVSPDAEQLLAPYVFPLLQLADVASQLGPNMVMKVEIDDCNRWADLEQPVCEIAGVAQSGHAVLGDLYNEYINGRFVRTPRLLDGGVAVMKDEESFLIQAADVLGNYAMAYTAAQLGKQSKVSSAKAELIRDVFGDRMSLIDFSDQMALVGNDIVLDACCEELRFRAGWSIVKGPDADVNN